MQRFVPVVIAVGAGFLAGWVARQPAQPVPDVVVRLVQGPIRVAEVPATCADPVTLACADCSEFPCLALFVRPYDGKSSAASCTAWRDAYGDGQTTSNGILIGPDGQPLGYELLGPVVPAEFSPPEPEPVSDGAMIAFGNGMKRLAQRGQEARDEVIAELGAREPTEAELRDQQRRYWQDRIDQGYGEAAQMLKMLEEGWAAEEVR